MRIKPLIFFSILVFTIQSAFGQATKSIAQPPRSASDAAAWVKAHEMQVSQESRGARLHLLQHLATAAWAAGDIDKAESFAKELLTLGDELRNEPGFGPGFLSDATYTSNTVRGLIALNKNDVESAKEHLLAAGRISGSGVLVSFGPGMLLAKQLIEKGQRDAVIQYFDLCAQFWKAEVEKGKLDQWKRIVAQGGIPDFGYSLNEGLYTWSVVP